MLCQLCQSIDGLRLQRKPTYVATGPETFTTRLRYSHQPDRDTLESAASCGCPLCYLILEVINSDHGDGEDFEDLAQFYDDFTEQDEAALDQLRALHRNLFTFATPLENVQPSSYISLELIFREPSRLEPITRGTDIVVYWTDEDGKERNSRCFYLVHGLSS